ncbi:MAG: transposase [Desulfobulbaceae bacterium]|nr:transposase [Desulfobulbaceae bacterium]
MIKTSFQEAFPPEWVKNNITNVNHELIIIRDIIPWEKIIGLLCPFYNKSKGALGKSLRMMIAILLVMKHYKLSDRVVVCQIKENRYMQYFCNVPDDSLWNFLDSSSLSKFRKRLGEKGIEIIEKEIFELLRRAGVIKGDNALIDSSVLENNVIYPNDVHLIYKAFDKIRQFAKLHNITEWWDDDEIKKIWRVFNLEKKTNRAAWLCKFYLLFYSALEIFSEKVNGLKCTKKTKAKAFGLLDLLSLLEEQTAEKLAGKIHIKNRIVSLSEPDARPIKKGKTYPKCEFGTTMQMTFNREGFMITVENFIGAPSDKTLFPKTFALFKERMKRYPDTVVTDLGYRSLSNFKIADNINDVFLGRSDDVCEEKKEFCCKARSATEGFIAVAKNLRGFGRSLYKGFAGDQIWSSLCQASYNLKKFLQLWFKEAIPEDSLIKLGLA